MAAPVRHDADRQPNTGSGKTIVALRPSNFGAGDRWEVGIAARDSEAGISLTPAIVTPPSGFELVYNREGDFPGTTHLLVYALVAATGGEAASVNFTIGAGADFNPGNWIAVSNRITGAAAEPFHRRNRSRTSNNQPGLAAGTVDTDADECLLNYYWTYASTGSIAVDPALSDGWAEGLTLPTVRLGGGSEAQATAGQAPVRTASRLGGTDGRWQSVTVALAPAGGVVDPPGDPALGAVTGVAPDTLRLTGLITGANSPTDHELWLNDEGDAFDGEVVHNFGPTLPATFDIGPGVHALAPEATHSVGIRAIKGSESAVSAQRTGATLKGAHYSSAVHEDVLLDVELDPTADGSGEAQDIRLLRLEWGKYEREGEGRQDVLVQLWNDGAVAQSWNFASGSLVPTVEEVAFDPIGPVVEPRLMVTALMPDGANGQQAAVYSIRGFGSGELTTEIPPPSNIQFTAISQSLLQIAWAPVSGAQSIEIQYGLAPFDQGAGPNTVSVPGASIGGDLGPFDPNTEVFVRVRVITVEGPGDWSELVSARTLLATPGGLDFQGVSQTRIDGTWNAVAGATGYAVQVATAPFDPGTGNTSSQPSGAQASISGLFPATRYYFRVQARNATQGNHSAWSDLDEAMTQAGEFQPDTREVIWQIEHADGRPWAGARLVFTRAPFTASLIRVRPTDRVVTDPTDFDGRGSVLLTPNDADDPPSRYTVIGPRGNSRMVLIPSGVGPFDITEAIRGA